MRIIAKNHDYYDSALAFGHDEHVVFERKEEKFTKKNRDQFPKGYGFMSPKLYPRMVTYVYSQGHRGGGYDTDRSGREFAYFPFTVAFCGKLYPGIRINSRRNSRAFNWIKNYAYTFDDYVALMEHLGLTFKEESKYRSLYEERKGSPRVEADCKEYFERTGEDRVALFAERGQPIVVYEYDSNGDSILRINSELRNVSFYKVFDAYTAFQELDMFISGIMTRDGNPMAGISDTDLRDKKGFNDKSFKKEPTKKR